MSAPTPTNQRAPSSRGQTLRLAALVAGVAAILAIWNLWSNEPSADSLLRRGRDWLDTGQFSEAKTLAERVLRRSPNSTAALLLAGQAALGLKQYEDAAGLFERVAPSDEQFVMATCAASDARLMLGESRRAEEQLQRAYRLQPDAIALAEKISTLYGIEGRSWERRPFLEQKLQQGKYSFDDLRSLANAEVFVGPESDLERFKENSPRDAGPLVGFGVIEYRARRYPEAEEWLARAVELDGDAIQAQALLGWLILQRQDDKAWLRWRANCPSSAYRHPLTWIVLGAWLEGQAQQASATRCFLEAAALDPGNLTAHLRAAQALAAGGRVNQAEAFNRRAEQLLLLHRTLEVLMRDPAQRGESIETIAGTLEELGRFREAIGWRELLLGGPSAATAQRDALARLRVADRALPSPGLVGTGSGQTKLEDFPLPDWAGLAAVGGPTQRAEEAPSVTFVDRALELGINFLFESGYDPARGTRFIHESVGGGVAAWDFDGDCWPDLYFTQGCAWPSDPQQLADVDRLYRSLGGARFVDVTSAACLGDNRYSGGVAAGDVDSDGFADLYIGNLGSNRLYRNNGDGTFEDISQSAGIELPSWTASCLIADLNGDGHPDLFDVTYVGDEAQRTPCLPRDCGPRLYPALQDRLWLSEGDGRFTECGEIAGIHAANGTGLGLVATDCDGSGRLSVFVANDETPNYWFMNQQTTPGGPPVFSERGMISGLALDGWGRAQGSMGVAAGDADGNGAIDFLVTNFENEANAFYLNQGDGQIFTDAAARCGLHDPSLPMLGFGTQFIDGELDGWLDLIVTNGHVHDLREFGTSYQMPTQYFRNLGQGQYAEAAAATLGPFFAGAYVGRGMARLDWNRDGLEDVAISHMESPAALLTNTTSQPGHYLALQLRGTRSPRDAFGATVKILSAGRRSVAQLTAGDGYMASNQRQLVFGLGPSERVEEVSVRWPSGLTEEFRDVAGGVEWMLIEGSGELAPLP